MYSLLLALIYLAFISLGLPDSLLGAAWPSMYPMLGVPVSFAGVISMTISVNTVISSLFSDRLTKRFGAAKVTAVSDAGIFVVPPVLAALCAGGSLWSGSGQRGCSAEQLCGAAL